jgi:ABC-type transport system involved in cytochrome bd biosynthesis fused ATPase/permease subunit
MISKELVEESVERVDGCDDRIAVQIKDGVFSWDDETEDDVLKNINLEIKKGELTAIVGTVGSGKSSLLASILGEMHKISGKVRILKHNLWGLSITFFLYLGVLNQPHASLSLSLSRSMLARVFFINSETSQYPICFWFVWSLSISYSWNAFMYDTDSFY